MSLASLIPKKGDKLYHSKFCMLLCQSIASNEVIVAMVIVVMVTCTTGTAEALEGGHLLSTGVSASALLGQPSRGSAGKTVLCYSGSL